MNLNERFDVSPGKVDELKSRIVRLGIDPSKIDEQFVRGSGPGGQKINKTNSCVLLRYGDIVVRCRQDRRRSVNRFLALRELVDKVEMETSPSTSRRLEKGERRKAAKSRAARRARAKFLSNRSGKSVYKDGETQEG